MPQIRAASVPNVRGCGLQIFVDQKRFSFVPGTEWDTLWDQIDFKSERYLISQYFQEKHWSGAARDIRWDKLKTEMSKLGPRHEFLHNICKYRAPPLSDPRLFGLINPPEEEFGKTLQAYVDCVFSGVSWVRSFQIGSKKKLKFEICFGN